MYRYAIGMQPNFFLQRSTFHPFQIISLFLSRLIPLLSVMDFFTRFADKDQFVRSFVLRSRLTSSSSTSGSGSSRDDDRHIPASSQGGPRFPDCQQVPATAAAATGETGLMETYKLVTFS